MYDIMIFMFILFWEKNSWSGQTCKTLFIKVKLLLFLIWNSSSEGLRSFFLLPGRNFLIGRGLLLESCRSTTTNSMNLCKHKHHGSTHSWNMRLQFKQNASLWGFASRMYTQWRNKSTINKQGSKHELTETKLAGKCLWGQMQPV